MNTYRQAIYTGSIRIVANLLMVGAIFLAMYEAARWPGWSSESVFCLIFFGVTVPVWAFAWALTRWVRSRWPAESQSMVNLPHLGPQLVCWRVLDSRKSRLIPPGCGLNIANI